MGARKQKQLTFEIPQHGGRREGAGRKKVNKHELPHLARPIIEKLTPVHVNIKLVRGLPNLRTPKFLKEFARAAERARRFGFNVQHFAIESNHLHLIAEVKSNDQLERGMTSLKTSIAWMIRKLVGHAGKVFLSRYHLHEIKTPTEMKNALKYVLFNHAKHTEQLPFADPYSSIYFFRELAGLHEVQLTVPQWIVHIRMAVTRPTSWLQKLGWRRGR